MATTVTKIEIGEYQLGEAPLIPLSYGFRLGDNSGPLDISDHDEVQFIVRDPEGAEVIHQGVFSNDKADGMVQVVWTTAMTNQVGRWRGIFWLYPGPVASKTLMWTVADGPGPDPTA